MTTSNENIRHDAEPLRRERASTYFVQDRSNTEELRRLNVQDALLTQGMGGVLTEQADIARFHRILDVGCGTGGWAIATAQQYPSILMVGVDISSTMIEYAKSQAQVAQIANQITFSVMDVLQGLNFADHTFDLVNVRLCASYVRKWNWHDFLHELQRVCHPGGIIRITESKDLDTNSDALRQLQTLLLSAMTQAGYLFESGDAGVAIHVPNLLQNTPDILQVQTQEYHLRYQAGTPEGQAYSEDCAHMFRTIRPMMQKHGGLPKNYQTLYQQALYDMQQPNFVATWSLMTVWGIKRDNGLTSSTRRKYALPPESQIPEMQLDEEVKPNTYIVQKSQYMPKSRILDEETQRLTLQSQWLAKIMGGVLSKQDQTAYLRLILDVGSGSGDWTITIAQQYLSMHVAGVDINRVFVHHAQAKAKAAHVDERVHFYVMDALTHLFFQDGVFDLVNLCLASSFLRKWDTATEWQKILTELQRVSRPGGILRITEAELAQSTSTAISQWIDILHRAMVQAGHFFDEADRGGASHLVHIEPLFQQYFQPIDRQEYHVDCSANSSMGQAFLDDMRIAVRTLQPFLQKFGSVSQKRADTTYDTLAQQVLDDLQNPAFTTTCNLVTLRGTNRLVEHPQKPRD